MRAGPSYLSSALISAAIITNRLVLLEQAARILTRLGRGSAAQVLLQQAVAAVSDDRAKGAILLSALARVQATQRRHTEAFATSQRALACTPHNPVLYLLCARLARNLGDLASERGFIERAVELAPDDVEAGLALAALDLREGNPGRSLAGYRRVAELEPSNANAHCGVAESLLDQLRHEEAIAYLSDQSAALSASVTNYQLLGRAYRFCGRTAEARTALERALTLEPKNVRSLANLAALLQNSGQADAAIKLHRRVVALQGSARKNATLFMWALLAAGRHDEAWRVYRDRVEYAALLRETDNVWQGEDLTGRSLLVIREGGPGDEIRDACAYADVIRAAGRVTITCEPRMLKLLERSFPSARFLPVKRERRLTPGERLFSLLVDDATRAEIRRHDFVTLSPELLARFRSEGDFHNKEQSYLRPLPELQAEWRTRLDAMGSGLKVGISWRSSVSPYHREAYYTQLADWGSLLKLKGIRFVTLQYGDVEQEISDAEQAFGAEIYRPPDLDLRDDFDGVAALISQLDLVLAPNNTVLELAGAVQTPVWYAVRVPRASDDWRLLDPATGQERLYLSARQIRGIPWDTPSLVAQVVARAQELLDRNFARPDRGQSNPPVRADAD